MTTNEQKISRVRRSKQDAQAMYDRISGWYDWLEGFWEKKARKAGLAMLGAKPGEIILEIGVGTGHGVISLAQSAGAAGRVYGVDLSPRMLDLTRARVKKMGLTDRVRLECGDAAKLNFRAEYFDAIFLSFTLELFDSPELPQVLGECWRVLRGAGRICVVSLSLAGRPTWMSRLYSWGHQRFPKYLDCRPIFVRQLLEEAGYLVVEATEMSMWGLPVESVLAKKRLQSL